MRIVAIALILVGCAPEYREELRCVGELCCDEDSVLYVVPDTLVACGDRPVGCETRDPCSDPACVEAMYALCGASHVGVSCDDSVLPPEIVCEPR